MPLPLPEAYRVKDPDLFKRMITSAGHTYRSLAHEVGCSKSEIGWIAGGNRTRPATAQAIADALEVKRSVLFVRQASHPVDNPNQARGQAVKEPV